MTLDDLCAEAKGLTPRAARMAVVMLRRAGPLPNFWQASLASALSLGARTGEPLSRGEIADLLQAAIQPVDRPDWLLNDEFASAHRFACNVHLAAEKWKSIVVTLLDYDENARH